MDCEKDLQLKMSHLLRLQNTVQTITCYAHVIQSVHKEIAKRQLMFNAY